MWAFPKIGSKVQISKTIETPDGGVQFEGTLNAEQLDLVLTIGLGQLFKMGLIPFMAVEEEDISKVAPATEGIQ